MRVGCGVDIASAIASDLPPPSSFPTPPLLVARARALGIDCPEPAAALLLAFLEAMLERNRTVNLTAIRAPEQALVLHALDALAIALLGLSPARALDLGSGNGFPGVAVAVLRPDAEVDWLERTQKKARALGELVAACRLDNVRVLGLDAAQAPALQPELRRRYDLITARAVGTPAQVGGLSEPLLCRGGRLVLWLDQRAAAPRALAGRLRREQEIAYALPEPAARRRRLAAYRRD